MKRIVRNQEGFTLIEIIAVLILLGILAAVAIPKYMDLTDTAREKAADGQIAEVKGRLNSGFAKYMLKNGGDKPDNSTALLTYVNGESPGACPTADTTEGDFNFKCTGVTNDTRTIITVNSVQGNPVVDVTAGYDFSI